MTNEEFKQESCQWLNPLGYYLHISTSNGGALIFSNPNPNHVIEYPIILCHNPDNESPYCTVEESAVFKMFLTLTSGKIQFRHPDIEKYIKVFRHYARLVNSNPPFFI